MSKKRGKGHPLPLKKVIDFLRNRRVSQSDCSSDGSSLPFVSDSEEKAVENRTNFYIKQSDPMVGKTGGKEGKKTFRLKPQKRTRANSKHKKSKKVKRRENDDFIESKTDISELDQDKIENRIVKVKSEYARGEISIEDFTVHFPFLTPYQSQRNIIDYVSKAVLNNLNALIESPTGTGKTLAILSAVCAIVKEDRRIYRQGHVKRPLSTVIYCTRTHSQISQVMKEIREKLPYQARAVPYASRQLLCIYDDVKDKYAGTALNHACKKVRSSIKKKIIAPSSTPSKSTGNIFDSTKRKGGVKTGDIEDIGKVTRCPFFPNNKKAKSEGILGQSSSKPKTNAAKTASDSFVKISKIIPWKSYAVEDYVKIGEIRRVCPYYLTRLRTNVADIVVMPYNYILDKSMRSMLNLPFRDSIVVFDEAHNIESVCEEMTCFELTINDLFICYQLLSGLCGVYQDKEAKEWSVDKNRLMNKAVDSKLLRLFVLKLIDVIESYNVLNNKNKIHVKGSDKNLHVFRMNEMFLLIANALAKLKGEKDLIRDRKHADLVKNFDVDNINKNFADNLTLIKKILETCILDLPDKSKILNKLFESLEKISSAYKISAEYEEDFFMFIIDEFEEKDKKNQRKLGFWCFNPAYAFREFVNEKPRSIILASGTLTPMNTFDNELQIDFPIKLENDHVISHSQAMVGIVNEGVDGSVFNFKYENRGNYTMLASVGKSLIALDPMISGGILVFFPSYNLLSKTVKLWKDSGDYKKFKRKLFIEPKSQAKFHATFDGYLSEIKKKKKALFLGVCRGKFAEGIDFTDDAARAVILVGIPYPQYYDPKVVLKREYMTAKKNRNLSDIGGQQWYTLQASRATNQAVGRVIRHAEDCGIVLLFDERFKQSTIQLSRWLKMRKKIYPKFDFLKEDVEAFFLSNKHLIDKSRNPPIKHHKRPQIEYEESTLPSIPEEEEPEDPPASEEADLKHVMTMLKKKADPESSRVITVDNFGKSAMRQDCDELLEEGYKRTNVQLDIDMDESSQQKHKRAIKEFKFCYAMNDKKPTKKKSSLLDRYKKNYSKPKKP